jgi:tRNA threonylcarbamoyladenosine biosynthesis protein TsaE
MAIDLERRSTSESETRLIGLALGRLLRGGDVLLLDGALGAGKTTLTRAIVEGMGLSTSGVASPTFVMVHEYERGADAPASGPGLIHVDAYRLRGSEELETIGWDRVLERVNSGQAAAIVEWAERLGPDAGGLATERGLAARAILEHAGEHERELRFELPEAWRERSGFEALSRREATTCPITGQPVAPDCPTYPFSSERARLADLHRWFSGAYQITRPANEQDYDDEGIR